MTRLKRLYHSGARQVRRGQVERVHRPKTCLGRFRLCDRLDLVNFPEPNCFLEVRLVERTLQALLEKDRLGNHFKMNERARQKNSVGIFEKPQRALPIRIQRSGGGNEHARIAKGADHPTLRSFRSGGSRSRAPVPAASASFPLMPSIFSRSGAAPCRVLKPRALACARSSGLPSFQ